MDTGKDIEAAALAAFGREISDVELAISRYYIETTELEAFFMKANLLKPHSTLIAEIEAQQAQESKFLHAYDLWKKRKEAIVSIFIRAINNGDRKKIVELAEAAAFFKKRLPTNDFDKSDKLRFNLLFFKQEAKAQRLLGSYTLEEIAQNVGYSAQSDISYLRRTCKELGIPIKPKRPARKR